MKKIDMMKPAHRINPIKPVETDKMIKTAVGVVVGAALLGTTLNLIKSK